MTKTSIKLRDRLAEFLGAAEGGVLEYTYHDAVKLTGHSCPTVAGAFAATRQALAALYLGEVPERGAIGVELRDALADGVAGVVASVAGLITGAAGEGGFKGLAGRSRQPCAARCRTMPLPRKRHDLRAHGNRRCKRCLSLERVEAKRRPNDGEHILHVAG